MPQPPTQLRVLQKRLLWFFSFLAIIGFGAGFYLHSTIYVVIGLLALGVVGGGVLRIVLDRRHLKSK
jgi:hypothetical protein